MASASLWQCVVRILLARRCRARTDADVAALSARAGELRRTAGTAEDPLSRHLQDAEARLLTQRADAVVRILVAGAVVLRLTLGLGALWALVCVLVAAASLTA